MSQKTLQLLQRWKKYHQPDGQQVTFAIHDPYTKQEIQLPLQGDKSRLQDKEIVYDIEQGNLYLRDKIPEDSVCLVYADTRKPGQRRLLDLQQRVQEKIRTCRKSSKFYRYLDELITIVIALFLVVVFVVGALLAIGIISSQRPVTWLISILSIVTAAIKILHRVFRLGQKGKRYKYSSKDLEDIHKKIQEALRTYDNDKDRLEYAQTIEDQLTNISINMYLSLFHNTHDSNQLKLDDDADDDVNNINVSDMINI